MNRLSRLLATRLRRLAGSGATTSGARSARRRAVTDAWARLQRALVAPEAHPLATRRRELANEDVRLVVTLVGQQGRTAVARILAACNGNPLDASGAATVALAVAASLGHQPE